MAFSLFIRHIFFSLLRRHCLKPKDCLSRELDAILSEFLRRSSFFPKLIVSLLKALNLSFGVAIFAFIKRLFNKFLGLASLLSL